ncbi:transposase [Photorhabdus khanii]|uniref:Transposase n=1 Tax=Photorhabdus khanii TaxID=1004150 RepID=A0A7C9GJ87_9GAMM|nr:transposase [Photorhabdus khanii]
MLCTCTACYSLQQETTLTTDLPLYRQETLFKQYGIELSRQTQSGWILKSAQLFCPFGSKIQGNSVTVADSSYGLNHSKDGDFRKMTHYMWVYCVGTDSPVPHTTTPNIVLYDYCVLPRRSSLFNAFFKVTDPLRYEQVHYYPMTIICYPTSAFRIFPVPCPCHREFANLTNLNSA